MDRIAENIETVQSQCGDLCKNIKEQNDQASERIIKMINDFENKITNSDNSNHDRVIKFTQNIKLSIAGKTMSTYCTCTKYMCSEFINTQKESIDLMAEQTKAHAASHVKSVENIKSGINCVRNEMKEYRIDLSDRIHALQGRPITFELDIDLYIRSAKFGNRKEEK